MTLAHSIGREGMGDFAELLAGVLEELKLHEGYAARWNVELGRVVPGEATLSYTDCYE